MAIKTSNDYYVGIGVNDKATGAFKSIQSSAGVLQNVFGKLGSSLIVLNQGFELFGRLQAQVSRAMSITFGRAVALEKAVAEVTTLLSDATGAQAFFTEEVLKMQSQFGGTQVDIARAYYQALSSGAVDAATSTDLLTAANKLAIGGVTTLTVAVDGLTTILNAYGLSASQATDVSDALFIGMKAGKTTIGELSASLGQAAALANATGVSFQELISAVSAITTGGVDTSNAVTQVRSAMVGLSKQTIDLQGVLAQLNITSIQAAIKQKGLVGVLKQIIGQTDGTTESLTKLFGRIEAVNAVLALTSGEIGNKFTSIMDDMGAAAENTGQVTQESFDKLAQTADFKLGLMRAKAEVTFTRIGNLIKINLMPILESLSNTLGSASDKASSFYAALKEIDFSRIANGIATMTAALVSLSIALNASTIFTLLASLKAIAPMFQTAAIAMSGFVQGALGVAAIFVGIGGAIDIVIRNLDPLIIKLQQLYAKVIYGLHAIGTTANEVVEKAFSLANRIGLVSDERLQRTQESLVANRNQLALLGSDIDILENKYKSAMDNIDWGLFGAAFEEGKKFLDKYNNSLQDTTDIAKQAGKAVGAMPAPSEEAGDRKISGTIQPLFDEQTIANVGAAFGETLGAAAGEAASTMASGMSAMASGPLAVAQAGNMILDAVKQIINLIPEILNKIADIFNMVTELPLRIANGIGNIFKGIGNLIQNLIPNIIEAGFQIADMIWNLPDMIISSFEKLTEKIPEMGEKFAMSLVKTDFTLIAMKFISAIIRSVPTLVKAFIKELPKAAKAFVDAFVLTFKESINEITSGLGLGKFFNIGSELEEQTKKLGDNITRSSSQLFQVLEMQAGARGSDLADRIRNAISSAVTKGKNIFQQLWAALERLWKWIKDKVIDPFINALSALWTWINEKVITPLIEALTAIWDFVLNKVVTPLIEGLGAVWNFVAQKIIVPLIEGLGTIWNFVVDKVVRPLLDGLTSIWNWVSEKIVSPLIDGLTGVWNWVNEKIVKPLSSLSFDSIITGMNKAGEFIMSAFTYAKEKVLDPLGGALTSTFDGIAMLFEGIFGGISRFIGGLNLGEIGTQISSGITSAIDTISEKLSSLFDGFKSFFNIFVDMLNGLKLPKVDVGGKVLGKSFGFTLIPNVDLIPGEIPKFQTGGFVGGTGTEDNQLALLTPGEFVVNRNAARNNADLLSNINKGTSTAQSVVNNSPINITINAKTMLDADQIRREVIPTLEKELKRKSLEGRFV